MCQPSLFPWMDGDPLAAYVSAVIAEAAAADLTGEDLPADAGRCGSWFDLLADFLLG
jgi:hypothetical protein